MTAFADYDCALSLTFMLQIRFNWRTRALWIVECCFHIVSIGAALLASIGAMITDSYSTSGAFACFPRQQPWHCDYEAILENDPDMKAFCDHAQWGDLWVRIQPAFKLQPFRGLC